MDRNALLAATKATFLQAFQEAADTALAHATSSLFRKADFSHSATEQRALLDAHRLLQDQGSSMREQLARQMAQLLNRSFQTTYSTFRPSFSADFTSETLSLVESTHLEDQLRIDDITNRFRNAAEQQLRDLNIRIALLFEQNTIKERENPFRPWLFTRCIANAAEALTLRPDLRMILSQQIAESLEESVALIYGSLNSFLAGHGIAAQLQLKVQRSHGAGSATPVASGIGGVGLGAGAIGIGEPAPYARQDAIALPGIPSADTRYDGAAALERMNRLMDHVRRTVSLESTGETTGMGAAMPVPAGSGAYDSRPPARADGMGTTLRRFFAGESALLTYGTAAPDARIAPHLGSRVDRAVSAPLAQSLQALLGSQASVVDSGAQLTGPSEPAPSSQQQAFPPTQNQIMAERSALLGATGDVSEQMTIDVVAMLFEFILRDHQIPAEVRAQLARLQFLVLKLALRESTLLTQQGHPARMLVNRIGSISVGLRQLDPDGERIGREICRIVEALLRADTESSAPFLSMLDEFDLFIASQFRAGDANVDRAATLIEQAQSRTLRFTHVAAQLDEALSGLTVDSFLREFLVSTWIYVIERAERAEGAAAAADAASAETASLGMRYRLLVADLLWSIVPHADPDSRTQLFKRLPSIVRTIREGLTLIGHTAAQQQPILDWLVLAHRSVLRENTNAGAGPTLAALRQHFDRFIRNTEASPARRATDAPASAQQRAFLDEALRESAGCMVPIDQLLATEGEPLAPGGSLPLQDGRPTRATDASDAALAARLRTGVAVEINLGGATSTARLDWVDQQGTALLLRIDGQPKPSMLSKRMFQRMLAAGRLRFVESAPLFERAIDSLLASAASVQAA